LLSLPSFYQGQQAASLGSVAAHGVLLLGDLYITDAAAEQGGPITLYFDPLLKSASALILRAFAYHDGELPWPMISHTFFLEPALNVLFHFV
jgi:hypothetical protein